MAAIRKQRRTFMIEPDLLDRLRAVKARTGLSESEQIRQGIRWWLDSREWPPRRAGRDEADQGGPAEPRPSELRPRGRKRR